MNAGTLTRPRLFTPTIRFSDVGDALGLTFNQTGGLVPIRVALTDRICGRVERTVGWYHPATGAAVIAAESPEPLTVRVATGEPVNDYRHPLTLADAAAILGVQVTELLTQARLVDAADRTFTLPAVAPGEDRRAPVAVFEWDTRTSV